VSATDTLLYGSLGCSAAFYLVTALVYLVRRPAAPPSLPAMSDLGPEPPAVANLLANGGKVTPDAVPATLFDLAARKVLSIEETDARRYQVRVGPAPSDLTRCESRVMRLLSSRASGGIVPAGALTLGSVNEARGWLRSFRGDVSADARARGLSKPRWPAWVLTLEGLLVFGAFTLAAIAANDDNSVSGFWAVAVAVALATAWVSSYAFRDETQMLTPSGIQAEARWLSLRKYLHDDELFATLPPTAVTVRARYIGYGAALGVAAAAVRAIPMGAESDRRAWSSVGGRWRQVTVSYPTLWPPAYGISSGEAAWSGVRIGGIAAAALWAIWFVASRADVSIASPDRVVRDIAAGAILASVLLLVALGVGLWLLLSGAVSLSGASTVSGDAIRLRQYGGDSLSCYLAVDDGTSDHVRAWRVRPIIYDTLTEYDSVTVTVTPLLGYVRQVLKTPAAAAAAPAAVKA
jgi:hypothetical protein